MFLLLFDYFSNLKEIHFKVKQTTWKHVNKNAYITARKNILP